MAFVVEISSAAKVWLNVEKERESVVAEVVAEAVGLCVFVSKKASK